MGDISFIYRRSLVGTIPIKPGKKIPLSPLDLLMEKHNVKMVYYFSTPNEFSHGEITKRLRDSLAQVLSYFHRVTGRLMKDDKGKWVIKCNDAGVRLVEARAKGSVEAWLENLDEEKEKLLIHWEDMFHNPYFWATMYIKVTEFEEGGVAVGLGCSHLLADPLSAALFMKSWTDISCYGKAQLPPFFHPLPKIPLSTHNPNNNSHLTSYYKSILQPPATSSTALKTATVALLFPSNMVRACIDRARVKNGPEPGPFSALSALLWTCIARVQRGHFGNSASLCFDVRKTLGLDKGYFGNCMVHTHVNMDMHMDDDDGNISRACNAIEEGIEKVDKQEVMDLIQWLGEHDASPAPQLHDDYNPEGDLMFINQENMEVYKTMFVENYEAIRVSCYIEPLVGKGKVLVLPAVHGSLSRVVMVTLADDEAVKLCDDEFLARFSPTILMGPKK